MKKLLIPLCLSVFLSSVSVTVFVGCTAGPGNTEPTGSQSQDVPSSEGEPSANETEPSTSPVETAVETEKSRYPTYIATAPEWPADPDEPENVEYDSTRYVELVLGNPHVSFSASTVEASGTPQALGPAFCFDGDPNTRWSSDQHDVDGCWICVDFAYPVKINGLFVNECKTWGKISAWEAQYFSETRQEWVTVYEDFSFTDDMYYGFGEDTEETYRFRLMFYESSSLAISLFEVGIKGQFVEVPEGTPPHTPDPGTVPGDDIPDELTNLALNGTYTASSSENQGNPDELGPYFCFDGKADTRWSTVFHDLYESWIAVDFGRTVTVSGFVVNEVTNWGHVTSYSVQIMENGEWKTVYDGMTFPTEPDRYIALPSAHTTTGFRLLFHDGETMSETVTISEILVLGQ